MSFFLSLRLTGQREKSLASAKKSLVPNFRRKSKIKYVEATSLWIMCMSTYAVFLCRLEPHPLAGGPPHPLGGGPPNLRNGGRPPPTPLNQRKFSMKRMALKSKFGFTKINHNYTAEERQVRLTRLKRRNIELKVTCCRSWTATTRWSTCPRTPRSTGTGCSSSRPASTGTGGETILTGCLKRRHS